MARPRTVGAGPAAGRPWHERHRTPLALAGAAVAAGMTVLWVVVVPEKAATTTGVRSLAIRWSHPLSWALLTGVALTVAVRGPRRLREVLAWSALGAYAAFLLALLV